MRTTSCHAIPFQLRLTHSLFPRIQTSLMEKASKSRPCTILKEASATGMLKYRIRKIFRYPKNQKQVRRCFQSWWESFLSVEQQLKSPSRLVTSYGTPNKFRSPTRWRRSVFLKSRGWHVRTTEVGIPLDLPKKITQDLRNSKTQEPVVYSMWCQL